MKLKSLMVLSVLISFPAFAQSLPDEINYPPYESRFRSLDQETNQTQGQLDHSRTSLSEAREFITEMTSHIGTLENHIRDLENEISNLRNLIPNLESQLASLNSQANSLLQQIRVKETYESNLSTRREQELRTLRPLEEIVAKKEQRIQQLESSLSDIQRQQREAESRLARAQNEHQQLEQQIANEREQQRQLRIELAGLENQINSAISQISQLESQLQSNTNQVNQERQRLAQLDRQVQEDKNNLAALRAQGPSQAQIQEAERKLETTTTLRDRIATQVQSLEAQLNKARSEISRLRTALPALESQLSTENQKLITLSRRVEEYTAELSQIRANGGTPEQIKDAERKLNAVTTTRDRTATGIKDLENQIRTGQSDLARYESQLSGLESQVGTERQKLANVERDVVVARQALDAIRNSGPSIEVIREAERKLAASTSERDRSASTVQALESQSRSLQSNLTAKKSEVENLRRSQTAIPTRIAQSESRERDLSNQRMTRTQDIARLQAEISTHARNAQNAISSINIVKNELRVDQQNVQNQVNVLENLDRQIQAARSELNSMVAQHKQLLQNINETTTRLTDSRNAIPQMQSQIKSDQQEIADGREEMARARSDEQSLVQTIAKLETSLNTLTRNRDQARNEMNTRLSLYRTYLEEARQLGRSQIQSASGLGEKEGLKIAKNLSKFHGEAVGKELGLAEAKYWGAVRGELAGFEHGYATGLQSVEDITRGQAEGRKSGKADAELTAQTKFRPQYFEEALIAEFQKPMEEEHAFEKMMKRMSFFHAMDSVEINELLPLSMQEITKSDELKTPLDASVISFKNDVKVLKEKAQSLEKPGVVYQTPATIPFGEVNCSTVYKNVLVFKQACDDSYKESFRGSYLSSSRSVFDDNYLGLYKDTFSQTNVKSRELQFPTEFNASSVIADAHGLKLGKADIYQEKFKTSYKETYESELPIAKEVARGDAEKDLVQMLQTKALLTLGKNSLEASDFRGGEEVSLNAQVKNISQVGLNSTVLLKIVESQNIEFGVKEITLTAAQARKFTNFDLLKGKINPSAKTGDKIMVKAIINLPGDLYKPQRQETFELSKTLSANPTHDLKLEYLQYPDAGNIFRRNLHYFKAIIKPLAENITTGYSVKLVALENANLIRIVQSQFETGAINQNEPKEIKFNYTFPKEATGKKFTLELTVTYTGKILKKEIVTVVPK